jgi:type I restriction enzyme S subunit
VTWRDLPIKRVFRVVSGSTPPSGDPACWDGDIHWVTPDDLGKLAGKFVAETRRTLTRHGYTSCGTTLVPPRSLILSTRAPIGHVAIAGRELCTNQGCRALRPTKAAHSSFFYYSLIAAIERLRAFGQGTTFQELGADALGAFTLPVPEVSQQRAIAAFLDRKTAAIDALIAKKERLIELLQEKRQALITHAVTNGLDPSARMKVSPIEWVGTMPEHWKTVRISYVADVCNGSTPDRTRQDYWTEGTIPWLSSGKVNDYIVEEADELITERALRETSVRMLPKGTVLVGMVGQGKTRGMSATMALSSCINQNVAGVTPRPAIDGRFLHHVLVAAYQPLREFGRGGQQEALNCEILKAFRLPLPPLDEQRRIATLLDEDRERSTTLSGLIEQHIDKLREYRQALITAAVTGKIDVSREAA